MVPTVVLQLRCNVVLQLRCKHQRASACGCVHGDQEVYWKPDFKDKLMDLEPRVARNTCYTSVFGSKDCWNPDFGWLQLCFIEASWSNCRDHEDLSNMISYATVKVGGTLPLVGTIFGAATRAV